MARGIEKKLRTWTRDLLLLLLLLLLLFERTASHRA